MDSLCSFSRTSQARYRHCRHPCKATHGVWLPKGVTASCENGLARQQVFTDARMAGYSATMVVPGAGYGRHMLDMDTARRPFRPSEWVAVLDAVYNAHPSDEQTWLEWKSTLDLRSKEQIATIVCKAIIALANRDPDQAVATVGGIGILLIGVEPGFVSGVVAVDNADLDQLISSYIGSDGPAWQPHWYQYQEKTILIIEVGAPRWGDPPHTFRRSYDKIQDGQIYVRKMARSAPADHKDVQRLAERYAARPKDATLDVSVSAEYPVDLSRYTWTEGNLDGFVSAERSRLMQPLEEARAQLREESDARLLGSPVGDFNMFQNLPKAQAAYAGPFGIVEESRTEAEYETQVEDYLAEVKVEWPEAMRKAAAYLIQPPVFIVTNLSERNYLQLEVKVHVAGEADAVEYEPDIEELNLWNLLPSAPRIWGPYRKNPFALPVPGLAGLGLRAQDFGPSTTIQRGGSFTLTFPPVDLRPGQTEILERDWVVLIPSWRTGSVTAAWTATATNIDGQARGEFAILFNGEDVNLYESLVRTAAG